jgi:hypothetical protein
MTHLPKKTRNKPGPQAITALISALRASRAQPLKRLAAVSDLSTRTVVAWLGAMRACDPPLVYVAGYAADARGFLQVPLYRFGNRPDAPRPGQSSTARTRAYRARQKVKKQARIQAVAEAVARSQPHTVWVGGPYA